MQKKPTKNKPERQGKTPTEPTAPTIAFFRTEPKNPVAGAPFKMIIEGESFGDAPWCEIIAKELLRQDLPNLLYPRPFDIEGRREWEAQYRKFREAVYGPCYLLERAQGRIVWRGILREPGVYTVGVRGSFSTGVQSSSEAIDFKVALATPGQQRYFVKDILNAAGIGKTYFYELRKKRLLPSHYAKWGNSPYWLEDGYKEVCEAIRKAKTNE